MKKLVFNKIKKVILFFVFALCVVSATNLYLGTYEADVASDMAIQQVNNPTQDLNAYQETKNRIQFVIMPLGLLLVAFLVFSSDIYDLISFCFKKEELLKEKENLKE